MKSEDVGTFVGAEDRFGSHAGAAPVAAEVGMTRRSVGGGAPAFVTQFTLALPLPRVMPGGFAAARGEG